MSQVLHFTAGNFTSDSLDEILLIAKNSSQYIYAGKGERDTKGNTIQMLKSNTLRDKAGEVFDLKTTVYFSQEKLRPDRNKDYLWIMRDDKYTFFDEDGKGFEENKLCKSQPCSKEKLIFSLGGLDANGLVMNAMPDNKPYENFMREMLKTLKSMQSTHDVYILINPGIRDKSKLIYFLDTLKLNNIPFVFQLYSSDSITIGSRTAVQYKNESRTLINDIYDVSRGFTLDINNRNSDDLKNLDYYKTRYGNLFAGLQMFEIFGSTFNAEIYCKASGNCLYDQLYPADTVWNKSYIESMAKYAKENQMFMNISDHSWFAIDESWYSKQPIRKDIQDILNKYPNTIYLLFNNNEPNSRSKTTV